MRARITFTEILSEIVRIAKISALRRAKMECLLTQVVEGVSGHNEERVAKLLFANGENCVSFSPLAKAARLSAGV